MICSNTFGDYSQEEILKLLGQADEFKEIFENANNILRQKKDIIEGKAKKPKVTVVEGATVENCVWIDPSIEVSYKKFNAEKALKPVHEWFRVYEEWFDQLYKLTIVNDHVLAKKSVFTHVANILVICSTFSGIIQQAQGKSAHT